MQETDRPRETSADHLNQAPGLNKEEVANRCAAPAPFLRFGVDSYFQDSIMTIEDQNGVDRVDRKA